MLKVLRSYRAFLAVQQVVRINILDVASCFVSFRRFVSFPFHRFRSGFYSLPKLRNPGVKGVSDFLVIRA